LLEGKAKLNEAGCVTLSADFAFAESISQGPEQKCIIRYPWKLIYNMLTEEKHLFRLDEDPQERHDSASAEPRHIASLESALFPALFSMSEAWHIELAGTESGHRFDLTIKAQRGLSIGRVHPYKLLDQTGRIVDVTDEAREEEFGSVLKISIPDLQGTYTLTFQVAPVDWPVEIGIRIDGASYLERVHIGRDLTSPAEMPFIFRRQRVRVRSSERPAGEVDPPYAIVWFEENKYGEEVRARHDEQTLKEFRALGYVQ
jgi:hypothetical protein